PRSSSGIWRSFRSWTSCPTRSCCSGLPCQCPPTHAEPAAPHSFPPRLSPALVQWASSLARDSAVGYTATSSTPPSVPDTVSEPAAGVLTPDREKLGMDLPARHRANVP